MCEYCVKFSPTHTPCRWCEEVQGECGECRTVLALLENCTARSMEIAAAFYDRTQAQTEG